MSTHSKEEISFTIRHDKFQSGMVESLMFGLYTSLVLTAFHKIVSKRGIGALFRRLTLLMFSMYALAIVHFARLWRHLARGFVDHASSELSTLTVLVTFSKADMTISLVSRGLMMFIGDYIMIWRCRVLYGKSWARAVTSVPMFLLIVELAMFITHIVCRSVIDNAFRPLIGSLNLAHLSLTLATTALTSVLIICRVVWMRGFKRYSNFITIIVESSAFYTCALIVYMPFLIHPTLLDLIPNALLVFSPGIASTLIIARVVLGRSVEHPRDDQLTVSGPPESRDSMYIPQVGTTTMGTGNEVTDAAYETGGVRQTPIGQRWSTANSEGRLQEVLPSYRSIYSS